MKGPTFHTARIEHRDRTFDIAYFSRGGGAKTLLYLHGLGCTKEDFLGAADVPELKDYRLVAFDFPGCGESTPYYREVPLGIDDLVAVTAKLVSALNLADLVVIGQSLGGLTALQFARRHPGLVTHLVDVEGNLAPEDCDIQSRDVFRHRFLGDEDAFFRLIRGRLGDSDRPGFVEFASTIRNNIEDRAYFDYCRSIVDYSDHFPLLQQFVDLPIPKVFIHGEANAHLSHLPRLIEGGVPLVSVPDSDHFPALSNPTFYYRSIVRFVQGRQVAS
jgi:pimeloyl-ACP methyl ester carboxylesterase